VLVQDQAVGTDLVKRFVYVVGVDKAVAYRAVTLGPLVDGLRVVRNGLEPDEVVLVNGLQRVRPGAPITPERVAMSEQRASGQGQHPSGRGAPDDRDLVARSDR
jgi:hypothetical protein